MKVLSGREASMFACFADVVVEPEPERTGLPPVAGTTAVQAFDETLAVSPRFNRAGLRAAVLAIELAPLLLGHGGRLRRLSPAGRRAAVDRLEHTPGVADAVKAMRSLAHMSYYGDDAVLRRLGFDADAIVERAAAGRAEAGRW